MSSIVGYVWKHIRVRCPHCKAEVDMPVLTPKDFQPRGSLVHTEWGHYVDVEAA